MSECFKCGVSGDRALLFKAVSEKGVVKICRKCSFEESIPIIKHAKEEFEKTPTVHERLSKMAGVRPKEKPSEDKEKLAKIANENFSKNVLEENPQGMVHNFHWIIMRQRRAKKLTQKQFAEEIEEAEEAIKMAEKGVLPKNDFVLINKIENHLGINIRKNTTREKTFDKEIQKVKENFSQSVEKDKIKFDEVTTKTLTIADLQEMKKKREQDIFEEETEFTEEPKKDLSEEDINKIIFGK